MVLQNKYTNSTVTDDSSIRTGENINEKKNEGGSLVLYR